jgi:peptide deformylase
MVKIVQDPDRILRKTAKDVAVSEIGSEKIQNVIHDMKAALHREPDGVAIAAPQIGHSLRMFLVAGFVFDLKKKNLSGTKSPDKIFINPEITKVSKETAWVDGEGCLSVRWIYGKAKRHKKASLRAYDETGKKVTMQASGLLAQIFQHEVDHLNGVLFIDHAKDIRHMTDEEITEYKDELKRIAYEHGH